MYTHLIASKNKKTSNGRFSFYLFSQQLCNFIIESQQPLPPPSIVTNISTHIGEWWWGIGWWRLVGQAENHSRFPAWDSFLSTALMALMTHNPEVLPPTNCRLFWCNNDSLPSLWVTSELPMGGKGIYFDKKNLSLHDTISIRTPKVNKLHE